MALKEVDKFLFDHNISLVVVTISDEEGIIVTFGQIRHMASGLLCSARFCEGNVLSFSTRTGGFREEWAEMRAPRVENCPITGRSTSFGTTGYVDELSNNLLGGGVREQ